MNNRVVIICTTVIVVFVVGAGVVLSHAPDGGDAAIRSIGLLFALLAPTISSIALIGKQEKISRSADKAAIKADRVAKDTANLTNGFMDEKIRANIHKVLNDREKGIRR